MIRTIINQAVLCFFLLGFLSCNTSTNDAGLKSDSSKSKPFEIGTETCIDSSKIDIESVCVELYDPVCGCDGHNYSNSCYAEKAGVTKYVKGECR